MLCRCAFARGRSVNGNPATSPADPSVTKCDGSAGGDTQKGPRLPAGPLAYLDARPGPRSRSERVDVQRDAGTERGRDGALLDVTALRARRLQTHDLVDRGLEV